MCGGVSRGVRWGSRSSMGLSERFVMGEGFLWRIVVGGGGLVRDDDDE